MTSIQNTWTCEAMSEHLELFNEMTCLSCDNYWWL